MNENSKLWSKIEELALAETSADFRAGPGYGPSPFVDDIEAWRAGREGRIPKRLSRFVPAAQAALDPEWEEYRRLRAKFQNV